MTSIVEFYFLTTTTEMKYLATISYFVLRINGLESSCNVFTKFIEEPIEFLHIQTKITAYSLLHPTYQVPSLMLPTLLKVYLLCVQNYKN